MSKYRPGAHIGTLTLAGRSDAAYRNQSTARRRHRGRLAGNLPWAREGARHNLQLPPRFKGKVAKGSSEGEVYALSEILDCMGVLRDSFSAFVGNLLGRERIGEL